MAKTLDIFDPTKNTVKAEPIPAQVSEGLAACPELRRKTTEPRRIRQQFLFPQSTLDRMAAAADRYGASKNSIVVAAVDEYLKKLEG